MKKNKMFFLITAIVLTAIIYSIDDLFEMLVKSVDFLVFCFALIIIISLVMLVLMPIFKAMVNLKETDLYEGEIIIQKKSANLSILVKDFGMNNLVFDKYMWLVGFKDKEAIGGILYLTNYRLIFQSHQANRVRGKISIFLPIITEIKDTSFFITRKICVETHTNKFEFVLWGIPNFINAVLNEKRKLNLEKISVIKDCFFGDSEKMGIGLKKWVLLDKINDTFVLKSKFDDVKEYFDNPLEAINSFLYNEVFDEEIVSKWQGHFSK